MHRVLARIGIAVCATALALGTAGIAAAQDGSAVDQYDETFPTAKGPVRPGPSNTDSDPIPQSNRLFTETPGPLDNIRKKAPNQKIGLAIGASPDSGDFQSSFSRSLGASFQPGSGSKSRLIVLLTIIIVATAALGIAAVRRQREINRR